MTLLLNRPLKLDLSRSVTLKEGKQCGGQPSTVENIQYSAKGLRQDCVKSQSTDKWGQDAVSRNLVFESFS